MPAKAKKSNNSRTDEIIRGIVDILIQKLDSPTIYLFGSRAKSVNSSNVDFDIACECVKPEISLQREIGEAVDKVRGLYKVDIIYLLSVEKEFKDIVLKTGKVIYDRRS